MRRSSLDGRVVRGKQERIDEVNEELAKAILAQHSLSDIRIKSLTNLDRWRAKESWRAEHSEWEAIIVGGTDDELITAMTDKQQRYVCLRQFAPYRGILDEKLRQSIWNEVVARNKYEPLGQAHGGASDKQMAG